MDETLKFDYSDETELPGRYIPVVLVIMLYKVALTFESVKEIESVTH